jgi:hypothetical protein
MSILFQQTLEKVTWVRISPAGMDDVILIFITAKRVRVIKNKSRMGEKVTALSVSQQHCGHMLIYISAVLLLLLLPTGGIFHRHTI